MRGRLRLGTFTPSVLLEVARRSGALDRVGLEVEEVAVASSPAQFAALRDGEYDAVFTSPDNVIAYHFLSANPLAQRIPLTIDVALDRGLGLSLWAAPTAGSDLRGARVGVDVATSGFAFVAFALLASRGFERDSYEVVALGSTPRRVSALLGGECDVTILNAGNQFRAREAGARCLGDASELGPYLGTVLAGLAERDPSERRRLGRALLAAAGEVLAGHHLETVREAARDSLGLDAGQAEEYRQLLLDPAGGLVSSGRVERSAVRHLVALRQATVPDDQLNRVESGLAELVADGQLDGN